MSDSPAVDLVAEIVTLLRPGAPFAKLASASGPWRVQHETERVFYSLTLSGRSRLEVEGSSPVILSEGDFVLSPARCRFSLSSADHATPPALNSQPVIDPDGRARFGDPADPVEVEQLVGYCTFGSPDAVLLVTLLPDILVIRGADRLGTLARLVADEARAERPARAVVLERLLEVLFIETLRSAPTTPSTQGLLRGLADPQLARALRAIHAEPALPWTVTGLAAEAGLSRSALFTRFRHEVGVLPMEYLTQWRMALAQDLLRAGRLAIEEVAVRVGYGSASAFSVAFTRRVGRPPGRFMIEA